jgi:hypothetical protein
VSYRPLRGTRLLYGLVLAGVVVGCSEVRDLQHAARAVAGLFPAEQVTATARGRTKLIITLTNAELGKPPDAGPYETALRIAQVADTAYRGAGRSEVIEVVFRRAYKLGPVGASGTKSFPFTRRELDSLRRAGE